MSAFHGQSKGGSCIELLTDSVDGRRLVFANDVEIDPSAGTRGVVYFTETSRRYERREYMFATMEGRAEGRLLRQDIGSGQTTVLQDGLVFPNGVALSRNKSFLAFCESTAMRCGPLCTFLPCWLCVGGALCGGCKSFSGLLRVHCHECSHLCTSPTLAEQRRGGTEGGHRGGSHGEGTQGGGTQG